MDMEKIVVDARGCGCPEPILKTKKAIMQQADRIKVLVDNNTAKENVSRFAKSQNYDVAVKADEDGYIIYLKK